MKTNSLYLGLFLSVLLFSCSSEKTEKSRTAGNLSVEISHFFANKAVILGGENYQNQAGETLKITELRYYVSNFKFIKADGSSYTVPQDKSYFLVDEKTSDSKMLKFSDIPGGDYVGAEFMLGVDSLRNTRDISERTGCLDVGTEAAGMYWSWNSGYIFFKMEGESLASNNGKFRYHIGGFGGKNSPTINNLKTLRLDFPKTVEVDAALSPMVHLSADLSKVFTGKNNFKIADYPTVMFNDFSVKVAENYSGMFVVEHVH